jgi:hypothetical protein
VDHGDARERCQSKGDSHALNETLVPEGLVLIDRQGLVEFAGGYTSFRD